MEERGVEGDEAEMSWGQVVRSLVRLYKNQSLILRDKGSH